MPQGRSSEPGKTNQKYPIHNCCTGTRHLAPIDISPPWTPRPIGRLAPTN